MNNMGVFCGPFRGPLEVAVLSTENKIEGMGGTHRPGVRGTDHGHSILLFTHLLHVLLYILFIKLCVYEYLYVTKVRI